MSHINKAAALLIALCLIMFSSCAGNKTAGDDPSAGYSDGGRTEKSYAELREEYLASPLSVRTSVKCTVAGTTFQRGYTLTETDDAYTAQDENGESFSCAKDSAASSFFTRACYLPPYETLPEPTDTAGEYTASFSGPGVLAFLLTGSPLFSGYATTGSAALAGDCVFTVHVSDGKISDYSYSFTLDVTDGDDVFSAQIVISSEVI